MSDTRLFWGHARERYAALALGVLVLVAFAPTLVELFGIWIERPEYGHGLLMPPVALWMIWERRKELLALERRERGRDALLAVFAGLAFLPLVALLLLGEMKLSWFLKPYAFVAALTGGIAILYGWRGLRALLAPLVVLALMCPVPWRILTWATLPLRRTAAVLATGLMDLSGLDAGLEGNIIHVPGIESLWIADACSGLRSALSLIAVAVLGCIFWRRHWALKAVVLASTIPIAVAVNGCRIWLTGLLSVHVSPDAAQGFFHVFEGFLLFGVAAAFLFGWAALLHVIVPRADEAEAAAPAPDDDPAPSVLRGPLRPVAVVVAALALALGAFGVYRIRAELGGDEADPAVVARMEASLRALPLSLEEGLYRGQHKDWSEDVIANSGADAYGAVVYAGGGTADGSFQVYLGGAFRNTENFHTPNVCMPSAGWETLEHDGVDFVAYEAGDDAPAMQRLLLRRGEEQMLVYYWFQAGARLAATEWSVRLHRLFDLLRGRPLSPTIIVSVYVPVRGDVERTEAAALRFLTTIGPYIREATASGVIHG